MSSPRREPEGPLLDSVAMVGASRRWSVVMEAAQWMSSRFDVRVFVRVRPNTLVPGIAMADIYGIPRDPASG
jgi:hypothetical protein